MIWEFQKKHPEYDDQFVYCDTDTLLYYDVTKDLSNMGDNALAVEGEVGPAFTFFNKGTLSDFCNTIEWFYTHEEGRKYLNNFVEEKKKANAIHGFSDMYAFEYFVRKVKAGKVIDAQIDSEGWNPTVKENVFRYDQNVNFEEDFELTSKRIKKFKFVDDLPYAYSRRLQKDVFFKGIHFQGKAKYEMLKFCGEELTFLSSNWREYYIIYTLKKLKGRLKKLLK